MKLSEEMRNFSGMHFPYREYADKVAQLEEENEALMKYAILLDRYFGFSAKVLTIDITRAIGAARAKCADALFTQKQDDG